MLKKILKVIKVLFILIIIAVIVALVILNVIQNREVQRLNEIFQTTQSNLNQDVADKDFTIQNLEESFSALNSEVKALTEENKLLKTQVEKAQDQATGRITGSILGFVSSDTLINQIQIVCATLASNQSISYCQTVSSIGRDFSISVPQGEYYVRAKLFSPATMSTVGESQGLFTKYVSCVKRSSEPECVRNEETLVEEIVKVAKSEIASGIDPIDWK